MSITAHYVSKDWTLESICLETAFAPESHTVADGMDGLQAWGVGEENVICITMDNGANIVAAVRDLKWPWISCFRHNLNLALNKEPFHTAGKGGSNSGKNKSNKG